MDRRLKVSHKDRARFAALVKSAASGDSSAIKHAFGGELLGRGVGLEATVLGIKYLISITDCDYIEVFFIDPLGREIDAHKLIIYMLNALERILAGKIVHRKEGLVGIRQLGGGTSTYLYEKRMINYLAVELDGSNIEDVEGAVRTLGGHMVSQKTATWSFEANPLNGQRIAVAFWQGEEGIPSGASVLFGEETRDAGIPIEEILAVTEMTIDRFVAFYRKRSGRKPRLFDSLYL